MRNFLFGLVLSIGVLIILLMLAPSHKPAAMPWDVTIMPDGNPRIFDIHLGSTTYRQAQQFLHEYGTTAIFSQLGKAHSVEAFFNSIHLGGLDAKVVLNLSVSEQFITTMLSRAAESRLQPSGAHRYIPSNQDNAVLINAPITALTYIPSVRLDPDMVKYRFGDAFEVEVNPTLGETLWRYPLIGLTVYFKTQGKTVLEYRSIKRT